MAKNLSAVKRVQTSLRNNLNNKKYKSSIKTLLRKALYEIDKIDVSNYDKATLSVSKCYSKIDKAIKKGVITKNSGARKKSILAHKLNIAKQS